MKQSGSEKWSLSHSLDTLRMYVRQKNLKNSKQRELIAEVFFTTSEHVRVDDLLDQVRAKDPKIGQATVYRTLKLLEKAGLAEQRQFGDGHTRYESIKPTDEHHDHLICTQCGRIEEFMDPRIEALQKEVAEKYGYVVTSHRMELYGSCSACLDGSSS
ncbi:MAG: transcriptional repressor [Deltaproteobacteria bacterium]|nr:transcriptional repressor [Deltaproteobacteria bacterium]